MTQPNTQQAATEAFEAGKAHGEAVGEAAQVRRRHARKGDTAEDVDAEMRALNACVGSLHGLDAVARQRVLLYLVRRYDAADVTEDGTDE